jgi:hypothetical protein
MRYAIENSYTTSLRTGPKEKAYKDAERYIKNHELHRLFSPENEGRCIQVIVNRIAANNGEKVGYSIEMIDITEDEDTRRKTNGVYDTCNACDRIINTNEPGADSNAAGYCSQCLNEAIKATEVTP